MTLFYATFQCGRFNVKKIKNIFFDPEKVIKQAFKGAHNRPRPQPRFDFPYHEISGPGICSLICVVFVATFHESHWA